MKASLSKFAFGRSCRLLSRGLKEAAERRRNRSREQGTKLICCVLGGVVVLGFAAIADGLLPSRGERCVIINADDAGMYHSVNRATIDAMEYGYVSSCSILVPCPGFDEFAAYARSHPKKDFGVHLDLTCEMDGDRWGPILGANRVPSLVDRDGFFWRTARQVAEHAKIDEVEWELRAQIERCRNAGIRISHLDHHMNVLFERADFIRLYVQLGLDFDLIVRYAPEPVEAVNTSDAAAVRASQDGLRLLSANGMPASVQSTMGGYLVAPSMKRKYYLDQFSQLKPGVTEIIVHCAYGLPGVRLAPKVERREAETRIFMAQDTADAMRRQGVTILTWRNVHESARSRRRPLILEQAGDLAEAGERRFRCESRR